MDTTTPPSPITALPDDDREPLLVSTQHASGSIGPFFAVMSVVVVLSVIACIFGRYCASWAQGPDASYDCLGWARRRVSGGRCMSGRCIGREQMPTAVPADLQPKIRKSMQLPVSAPQPIP